MDARAARPDVIEELVDEELEAALSEYPPSRDDAYDAVAPDDLASEYLARATEARAVVAFDETLDVEVAELLRDAGMSVVSEGSLNAASPDELEAAASAELEGLDDEKREDRF